MSDPKAPSAATGTLDRGTFDRMASVVRYVERMMRNDPAPRGNAQGGMQYTQIARATSTISAASGLTYGTGTVTFLQDSGSALADSTLTGITVKNLVEKTIASGSTNVLFLGWAAGHWWVLAVRDCSMLS